MMYAKIVIMVERRENGVLIAYFPIAIEFEVIGDRNFVVEGDCSTEVRGKLQFFARQILHQDRRASGNRRAAGSEAPLLRSEEHTSELQSLMRISYAVFCLTKKNKTKSYNVQ